MYKAIKNQVAGIKAMIRGMHQDHKHLWSWLRGASTLVIVVILGILIWKNLWSDIYVDIPPGCKEVLFVVLLGKAGQKWIELKTGKGNQNEPET